MNKTNIDSLIEYMYMMSNQIQGMSFREKELEEQYFEFKQSLHKTLRIFTDHRAEKEKLIRHVLERMDIADIKKLEKEIS